MILQGKSSLWFRNAEKRAIFFGGGLLVFSAFFAYHNTLSVPFLFDDRFSISANPTIQSLWPPWLAFDPPSGGSTVSGRPLVNFSLALNYALSGHAVWSYHAINLIVHLLAGLLLFGVVRRSLLLPPIRQQFGSAALPLALIIALLWTLHPLQTEAVTYISQRSESMVGLFLLFTLYAFIRGCVPDVRVYDSNLSFQGSNSHAWLGVSFIACLLGMFTKEVMVSAPLVVLLYDRSFVAGSFAAALRARRWYYFGVASCWLALIWLVVRAGGARGSTAGFGLGISSGSYALTQCQAIALYLKLALWPTPPVFDYGTEIVGHFTEILPQAFLVIILLAGTVYTLWVRPVLGFVFAWFFVILAPSTSFVPITSQTMAAHRMYLPLAAVITLLILCTYAWIGRRTQIVWAAVALALCLTTMRQNEVYRDELALWSDVVARLPANPRGHVNLAVALIEHNRPDAALVEAREALRLRADNLEAQSILAIALARTNHPAESLVQANRVAGLLPGDPDALTNHGIALAQSGRPSEALLPCQTAVRLRPADARLHSNLGVVLAQLGRWTDAIEEFRGAQRLAPGSADSSSLRTNLGHALFKASRFTEAISEYEAVLRLTPDVVEVHFQLGLALGLTGRVKDAISHFEKTLALEPNHSGARMALAALRSRT